MRPYLEGYRFIIITDHQALKWLNSIDNPSGRLARWALELQQFDFEIKYRKGKLNIVADALSRDPLNITAAITEKESCNWYRTKIAEVQKHPAQHPDFMIQNGELYRRIYTPTSLLDDEISTPWKLCVPTYLRPRVLKENHDDPTAGHGGIQKTICRIAKAYYWPGMFRDVAKYVRQCDSCLRHKVQQQKIAGEMYMTKTDEPWETISADFMGPFPRSKKGNTMILVFQDKFTKWAEFIPLHDATTPALIKAFKERIFGHFGCPKTFISDNGKQFTSQQFRSLLQNLGIKHRLTPPYTPQSNPTERTNRVLKTMIAQYIENDHREWDKYLPELMLAYNTSQSETTGYSPAFLNYGREPLIPTSLYSEVTNNDTIRYPSPTVKREKLQEAFNLVRINIGKAFSRQSHYYNLRRRPWQPKIGDLVLRKEQKLSSASKNFTAKLGAKFQGPFRVTKIPSPVIVQISTLSGKSIGQIHIKDLKPYNQTEQCPPPQILQNTTNTETEAPTTSGIQEPSAVHRKTEDSYKRRTRPSQVISPPKIVNTMGPSKRKRSQRPPSGPTCRQRTRPRKPPTSRRPTKAELSAMTHQETRQSAEIPLRALRPFEARTRKPQQLPQPTIEEIHDQELIDKINELILTPTPVSPLRTSTTSIADPPQESGPSSLDHNPTITPVADPPQESGPSSLDHNPTITPDADPPQEPGPPESIDLTLASTRHTPTTKPAQETASPGPSDIEQTATAPTPIQQAIAKINAKPKGKQFAINSSQGRVRCNQLNTGHWIIRWKHTTQIYPGQPKQ